MKINTIRFKNIHSLKGEHEIRFNEGVLDDAGLYAITGPTGSGKSTLLDVITLALYNQIPRISSTMSSTKVDADGGVMTRTTDDCYAEVEYVSKGVSYRSHWSIRRNSRKTIEAHKHELHNVSTGVIMDTSPRSVPKSNETVIGLDYTQFVQAMVLSQGQFSRLLHSERKERNKLLEEITGAKQYRRIGIAAHDRLRTAKQNVKLQEAKLTGIEILPNEIVVEKTRAKKELQKKEPLLNKAYKAFQSKLDTKHSIQRFTKEKEEHVIAHEAFVAKDQLAKSEKKVLETHNRLSKYQPTLDGHKLAVELASKIKQEELLIIGQIDLNQSATKEVVAKCAALISKPVKMEQLETDIESFRKRVVSLQNIKRDALQEVQLRLEALEKTWIEIQEQNRALSSLNKVDSKACIKALDDLKSKAAEAVDLGGEKDATKIEGKIEDLEKRNSELLKLLHQIKDVELILDNQQKRKTGIKSENESLIRGQKKIKELEKSSIQLEKEVGLLEKQIEEKKKHESLAEQRGHLKEGQECPLCGALDHPFATNSPVFSIEEQTLDLQKKLWFKEKDLLVQVRVKVGYIEKQIVNLSSDLAIDRDKLLPLQKDLTASLKRMNIAANLDTESIEKLKVKEDGYILVLKNAKSGLELLKMITSADRLIEQWEEAEIKKESAQRELNKCYLGGDVNQDVSKILKIYNGALATGKELKIQLKKNEAKQKVAEKSQSKLGSSIEKILAAESMVSLEVLRTSILSIQEAEKLRTSLRKLEIEGVQIETAIKENSKVLTSLDKKDDKKYTLEELIEHSVSAEETWTAVLKEVTDLGGDLKKDATQRDRLKDELTSLDNLKREESLWSTLDKMIGGSSGDNFSNFVQDLTMEQLIGFTNKRLLGLSDRYQLQTPTAQDTSKKASLKIYDAYMGNQLRAVKTLSGGETFIVSLAMAFALSDLAAKNIRIESIFIDEGFGTLDPETLDQAISILEKLQSEDDKSIGVISHVAALKERISTQIKLEKSGAGYSSFTIE